MVVAKIKIMILGIFMFASTNTHVFANISPNTDTSEMYDRVREEYASSVVPLNSDLEGTWSCLVFSYDTNESRHENITSFRSHGNRFVERLLRDPNSTVVTKYGFILNSNGMSRKNNDYTSSPYITNTRFHSATGNLIFEWSREYSQDPQIPPAVDQPELRAGAYEVCRKLIESEKK
jgi:hypothetical protein